ncbi:16S rRNA (guanine(527)-N(7))-methyltransferase RsmG [Caldalkalibacillus salinus]|uniref:16S rRNA (guanine(527)-N(7))-methyltransferase RsmG n=1 Tax=Caldalkalibacillus salinus TaxID=2803787 RepID=UPI0019244DA6|nr:16S rRNA (guanine(527)-N(7))-methyltransferase RsmG [Caldalkalibacillus salinus]
MNEKTFVEALEQKGITLSEEQLYQFRKYYNELVQWNEKMNLTAITDQEAVYLKHFYDSLTAAFYHDFDQSMSIVDIGAGAGFPSLPLKICFPHLSVTIVDSLNKRIKFLGHLVETLDLNHVHLHHKRAEEFGRQPEHRQAYDIAMARAVARLNVLSELCLPLVKVEGRFIAMKGAKGEEEQQEARNAIGQLGGKVEEHHTITLPQEEGHRSMILIDKIKPTPKQYPRKPGIPNKKPIR